jgi:hypothetical protein
MGSFSDRLPEGSYPNESVADRAPDDIVEWVESLEMELREHGLDVSIPGPDDMTSMESTFTGESTRMTSQSSELLNLDIFSHEEDEALRQFLMMDASEPVPMLPTSPVTAHPLPTEWTGTPLTSPTTLAALQLPWHTYDTQVSSSDEYQRMEPGLDISNHEFSSLSSLPLEEAVQVIGNLPLDSFVALPPETNLNSLNKSKAHPVLGTRNDNK